MNFSILKTIGALLTALVGLYSLIWPGSITGFTGLIPQGGRGITEIRAVLGGLFIAIGLAPILLRDPIAYRMLGYGYLGIAAVRLVSIFVDKSAVQSNWLSLAWEILFGIFLVW